MTSKKKSNKKYVMVAVDPETRDILNFIRKGTGKPTAEFLKEFCSTLMQLVARYDVNKFNLELEYSLVPNPAIIIRSTGASTFVIASLDERAKAKLRREMFQNVALDIASERQKDVFTSDNSDQKSQKIKKEGKKN